MNTVGPEPPSIASASAEAFGEIVHPYRHELLVHCYRMLGSIDDAEDAVQEALTNAWRRRETFRRDVSLRAWLYRIATNASLDAIERRGRGRAREENLGVGPFPDELMGEPAAGPEARYDARETVSLAFLRALQLLPPRQRAALILCDVLGWRASEVAGLLELSVPSVNSALQRARVGVARRYGPPSASTGAAGSRRDGQDRGLLERYVRAWEAADIPGLVALLREDAVLSMPPAPAVAGAAAIGAFLARTALAGDRRRRLVPTSANGQPAFVATFSAGPGAPFEPFAVLVVEAGGGRIDRIDAFFELATFARFGAAG